MTTYTSAPGQVAARDSYPTLKPALRIKVTFNKLFDVGSIYTGSNLVAVPFYNGTLDSVGDFEPKLHLAINNGIDWFRIDADKAHGRLSVKAIATDAEGRSLCLHLDGVTALSDDMMPLILGDPSGRTSPFGLAVETLKIDAGHDVYRPLESMVFAASQRFTKEEDGSIGVDLRVSQILPGSGLE